MRIYRNQADIDKKYEQIYLFAKNINCIWQNNFFRHNYVRSKLLPIFKISDELKRNIYLSKLYCLNKNNIESKFTTIFILAAGQGVRWEKSHLKQLAVVDGKPLIERTLQQVPEAIVVTRHSKLMQYSHVIPSRCRYVLETILSTQTKWSERTIILLGDTYYDNQDLEKILSYKGKFAVFGSRSQVEIFGLSFAKSEQDNVRRHLVYALHDAYMGGRGKIWEMYHSWAGLPMYKVGIGKDFIDLKKTTDVDTIDDYMRLINGAEFKTA